MPPLSLKSDSSFFRKIALGAVGARAVCRHLDEAGHETVELERGSTETKLWKEVKRKRVRIPDLVCKRCGLRVECRAKSKPELSMSHSTREAERAWDYGMVNADVIAFPICRAVEEQERTNGKLGLEWSYWRGRNWVKWQPGTHVNYFRVDSFRENLHGAERTKGAEEGSETFLTWDAVFSNRFGRVSAIEEGRITVERAGDGHRYTWQNRKGLAARVGVGDNVSENQVLASNLAPLAGDQLACPGDQTEAHVGRLLTSVERTQRFTGVKLARLLTMRNHADVIANLCANNEEDVYIRLECASYSASVARVRTQEVFRPFLNSPDEQTRLEAVIALAECGTDGAVAMLSEILGDPQNPYFLRSAAAWGLGQTRREASIRRLVQSFADLDPNIRDEALDTVVSIGSEAIPFLIQGLSEMDQNVAAGCAESLRRRHPLVTDQSLEILLGQLRNAPSQWAVWLAGNLPRERVAPHIAELQQQSPQLHYAITLLWMFVESWIARSWELKPEAGPPND